MLALWTPPLLRGFSSLLPFPHISTALLHSPPMRNVPRRHQFLSEVFKVCYINAFLCNAVSGDHQNFPSSAGTHAPANPMGSISKVSKIICRAGVLVDQIKFVMNDGSEHVYGGTGGNELSPFFLSESEVITKIEGEHRAWASHPGQTLLGSIRFTTSLGNTSPWYGKVMGHSDNLGNDNLGQICFTSDAVNPIVGIVSIRPGLTFF